MALTNYQYTISTDFPNAKVNGEYLQDTIAFYSGIVTALSCINVNIEPDKCDIWFVDPLSVGDEAILDAVVAAHQGFGIAVFVTGTAPVTILTKAVVSDVSWETVFGIVTTPSFFWPTLTEIMGRVLGLYQGDGGELRIVEQMQGQADVVMASYAFPVAGSPTRFRIDTTVPPRDGTHNIYQVECRLNGATNLTLQYTSFSMMKVIVY